jgi:hypothetical protein
MEGAGKGRLVNSRLLWQRIAKSCPHSAMSASNIRVTPRLAKLVFTFKAIHGPCMRDHHAIMRGPFYHFNLFDHFDH